MASTTFIDETMDKIMPVLQYVMDVDTDIFYKSWNDIVYSLFQRSSNKVISDLTSLAYTFNNYFQEEYLGNNMSILSGYFNESPEKVIKHGKYVNDKDYKFEDDSYLVSFKCLKHIIEKCEDEELQNGFELIDRVFNVYKEYRENLIEANKYPTHWALFELKEAKEEGTQTAKITVGSEKTLNTRIERAGKRDKLYSQVSTESYESIALHADIEIDGLGKFLKYKFQQEKLGNVKFIRKQITFPVDNEDFTMDTLVEYIDEFRSFMTDCASNEELSSYELSRCRRTKLTDEVSYFNKAIKDEELDLPEKVRTAKAKAAEDKPKKTSRAKAEPKAKAEKKPKKAAKKEVEEEQSKIEVNEEEESKDEDLEEEKPEQPIEEVEEEKPTKATKAKKEAKPKSAPKAKADAKKETKPKAESKPKRVAKAKVETKPKSEAKPKKETKSKKADHEKSVKMDVADETQTQELEENEEKPVSTNKSSSKSMPKTAYATPSMTNLMKYSGMSNTGDDEESNSEASDEGEFDEEE